MKKIISEQQLNKIVNIATRKAILEMINFGKKQPRLQVKNSINMNGALANGFAGNEQNLQNVNNFYGDLYRRNMAQEGPDFNYMKLLEDLYYKLESYIDYGYFGNNQQVIDAVGKFCELLNFNHGQYEAAVSRATNTNNANNSGNVNENMMLKRKNQYGVRQKIRDRKANSGNESDKWRIRKDTNGQWIVNLRNELNDLMEKQRVHGDKTIQATKEFINFLTLSRRNGFAMAAVSAIPALLFAIGNCSGPNNTQIQGNPTPNNDTVPAVTQNNPGQNISIENAAFEFNSSEITQETNNTISSLQPGNYSIKITNAHGGTQEYNNSLYQQRANSIKSILPQGVNVQFVYGGVDNSANEASVEISPLQSNVSVGNFNENKRLQKIIKECVSKELRRYINSK